VENKIALNYIIYGRFGIDFIASLPLEVLVLIFQRTSANFRFLSMIKMARLLRLRRMITFLKANQKVKFSMKIFQLIFFLILINHWINCIWYFITNEEKQWFPPKDLDHKETSAYTADSTSKYNMFYYYGMLILVGNEVLPSRQTELIVLIILILLGTVFIGMVIGEFASILALMTKNDRKIADEIDIINNIMLGLQLPEDIQGRVMTHYENISDSHFIKDSNLYDLLSPNLVRILKIFQIHKSIGHLSIISSEDYSQLELFLK